MNAGEVTQIGMFARFNDTAGPGYMWHCHIIDHEDNDMMRPFQAIK